MFRDGQNQATSSLDCGKVATFHSETYARFGATAAPASQRKRKFMASIHANRPYSSIAMYSASNGLDVVPAAIFKTCV